MKTLISNITKSANRVRLEIFVIAKRISLPGFQGQSLYDVMSFFLLELKRNSIQVRATSVAFHFLMAIFPALIVFFTLIPYLPIPEYKEAFLSSIQEFIPSKGFDFIYSTLDDILNNQQGGLLSISILLSLYYSSQGVIGLMQAFDKSYATYRKRNYFEQLFVSIQITFLLIILLVLSIALIVGGQWLIPFLLNHYKIFDTSTVYIVMFLKWIITILFFIVGVSLIYYYTPAFKTRWRFITPGSILSAFLSILASLVFSYFMNNFSNLNKLYGSIGTLIIIMLWIYWNAMILLIGYELNVSIDMNRHNKSLEAINTDSDDLEA